MSDEALNAHLDWQDDCAKEQMSEHDYTARVVADAPGLAGFMEEVANIFNNSGAVNYLEMEFRLKDNELGPLVITIQRKEGKTPHQLRQDLESEHAALKREYGLLEVTYEEVLKDKGQLLDENAVLIKRLWDYEHQASDERIRDEK